MKSGALRRAMGLAFLYIGCFVLLVLLQFSRGPGFSERFGRLAATASFPKGERSASRAPDSVRLDLAGLAVTLSSRSPAYLVGADGASRPLAPRAIEKRADGVRVVLEGGVVLSASAGKGDRLTLWASGPRGAASLRVPFAVAGRARLVGERGAYRLESGTATFDLAFAAASIDGASGYLVLQTADGGEALGRLALARRPEAAAKPGKPAVEQLAAQAPKDAAGFKAEVDAWRDKAWAGLSSARYDAERVAWRVPEGGESRFTERALAAYLAEALARGSYAEAIARMRPARERWAGELGFLSAPYLGGLVRKMEAHEVADAAEIKRIAQLVQDKSPELFAKEGLVHFLLDRAPAQLARDAFAFAATVDPAKLGARQAVGLLGCAVEARSCLKEPEDPFRALAGLPDRVLSFVRKAAPGYYLVSEEDGSAELRLSLLAGEQLAAYGAAEGKDGLIGIGQGLVEGFLGLADDQGIVPSKVVVRDGAVAQRSGSLLPEEAYPIVAANPYYPREVSFYRELGSGVWAWTCAPSLAVSSSPGGAAFAVSFPEGRAHYMTFYGIKPFVKIKLYDIDYSPDAEFEIYDASGYLYRKETGALYMKMKHKKPTESVELFF